MPDSRFPPIAFGLLLIACICIYGIILDPGVTFAGMDFLNLNYPRAVLTKDAFSNGVVPLWNWYEWGGAPLLASLQGAVFYPPTWIALLLPLPYGLQVFIFAHLLAAGYGAYLVARRVGKMPATAAVVGGIIFMGSSFFPGRIEQFQIVAVNCLLPWLILAVYSAARGRRRFRVLPGVWALTLLAGHPQYAVFNLLAALVFTALAFPWQRWPYRWKSALAVAVGIALGSGIAALQLLPTWELGRLSERIWPYPEPTLPELEWRHLPALLIPKYYQLLTGETGRIFGYTELGLYAGVIALPFAIAALIFLGGQGTRRKRFVIAATIVWAGAMIFALGKSGLIAPFVFKYVPFFTQTRGAARTINVATLMLALLAAQGLAFILKRAYGSTIRKGYFVAMGVALLTCADLALNHFAALKSVLVPVHALAARPMKPDLPGNTGRLYRFMAFDSDLYLNNSPAAVAERHVRVQPNLSSVLGVPLTDGYEEGLLPNRTYANLQRQFNRNLRSDSPDAALLAFLGAGLILTEYPLQPGNAWQPASPVYPRSHVVPPTIPGAPATYQYWKSRYSPTLAVDLYKLDAIADASAFLQACAHAFPLVQNHRLQTRTEPASHPLTLVSAAAFNSAQQPFAASPGPNWNTLELRATGGTTSALVLMRPYPGWKVAQMPSAHFSLKSLCSLFYKIELGSDSGNLSQVSLVFAPFSYRLGLFISFVSVLVYVQTLLLQVCQSRQRLKVNHERER